MNDTMIGIISILAGFVTIWINEILTHKRDKKHKKEELMLSHLKEMLEWLSVMRQDIFKVSRMLITSSGIYSDPDRKKQLQRDLKTDINEMVEKSIILCDSYAEINNSIGIDLELSELNKAVGRYAEELRDILKMYPFPDIDDKDLNIVNEKTAIIQEEIKKRISVISKEISGLLTI
ncbi:MAG: hypothetical protein HDR00_03715 [Lachnospiraceae bacterium]|nr:hypothetical protein [Lachnospiraceae bacterium]